MDNVLISLHQKVFSRSMCCIKRGWGGLLSVLLVNFLNNKLNWLVQAGLSVLPQAAVFSPTIPSSIHIQFLLNRLFKTVSSVLMQNFTTKSPRSLFLVSPRLERAPLHQSFVKGSFVVACCQSLSSPANMYLATQINNPPFRLSFNEWQESTAQAVYHCCASMGSVCVFVPENKQRNLSPQLTFMTQAPFTQDEVCTHMRSYVHCETNGYWSQRWRLMELPQFKGLLQA